jgi:hypothetical protein
VAVVAYTGASFIFDLGKPFAQQQVQLIAPSPKPDMRFVPVQWTHDATELIGYVAGTSTEAGQIAAYAPLSRRYREIWSPPGQALPLRDGRRLLLADDLGRLWLVDPVRRTSRPLLVSDLDEAGAAGGPRSGPRPGRPARIYSSFALSADERWIYYTHLQAETDVWLAELK